MIVAFTDRANNNTRTARRRSSDAITAVKYTGNAMIVPFHRRKSDSSVSKASSRSNSAASSTSRSGGVHSASRSNPKSKTNSSNRNIMKRQSSSKSTIIQDPTIIDEKWGEKKNQQNEDKPNKTAAVAVSSSSTKGAAPAPPKEPSLPVVHRPRSHRNLINNNNVEHSRSASWVDRTFASIRRESVSSIDSKDMIVEFPRRRRRKSTCCEGRFNSKKADPIGTKSDLSRFISKSDRHHATSSKRIDRSVASCPTNRGSTSSNCNSSKQEEKNRRRLHTSERTFYDTVDWRNTSIDWGDDDDNSDDSTVNIDESESTRSLRSSSSYSNNGNDASASFVPEKVTRTTTTNTNRRRGRGRDPAGWSAIDISSRSTSDSTATPGLMESGRTMASSLSSILSGSLRSGSKPDP